METLAKIDLGVRVLDVVAANGVPFRVVRYAPGATGPYPAAADADKVLVEFYDRRYPHTEHGQFTGGRYYADTLLGTDGYGSGAGGVNLLGYEPAWSVDACTMALVRSWLRAASN